METSTYNYLGLTIKSLLLILLITTSIFANNTINYIQKAKDEKLWQDKYWKLLLHIPSNNKSEIDSPSFFLAKDGKTNPKNELLKTIESILNPLNNDDNSTVCKYPARTHWIKNKLNINNIPKQNCTKLNKWLKELDPTSASLVFSSAHINSPASMFGHTFLRIDSSFNSKLLSHAVNYAASANQDTENGFVFAIKGLFGGYYGQYSLLPYYEKLKEYRDTEQRDIWEYDLNLSKSEVEQMVRHIWELKDSYSNYYFFDENCSYNMLWLIEVAREDVNLRKYFIYQVSPPETIFAIEKENLIKEKKYRPSKRTKILAYEKNLDKNHIKIVEDLSLGNIELKTIIENKKLPIEKKQNILEVSLELCEYYFIQGKMKKEKYLKIFHNLSKARASLGKGEKVFIKTPANPNQGHRQFKISAGYKHKDNKDYGTFGIRTTYHDLTNNDNGFLKGTQIEMFNLQLLYDKNSIKTDYLKLLTIKSIAPKTKLFDPLSWLTTWQFDRDGLDNNLNFNGKVSAGKAYFINDTHYWYAMADVMGYDASFATSAIGATLGGVFYTSDYSKLNIDLSYKHFDTKQTQRVYDITHSFFPSQNSDIKINYKFVEKLNNNEESISLTFNLFF